MLKMQTTLEKEAEDALIKGCIAWDRKSQNELYHTYSAKMFAVCYKYSASREEAEDTFHEGFMKVFQNIQNFKKEGSLEGWIRVIMVNTALEKFRKNKRMVVLVSMEDNHVENRSDGASDIFSQFEAEELMQMIHRLPPQYKIVFNLYEFEGLKHKEIAEELGISEGTSKSNLSRAKAILQKEIKKNNALSDEIKSK
jgi:RNA polymerase sigma factor (sigma-70 family)